MVDLHNQNMGRVDLSDQAVYSYALERKSKSHSKKGCIQPSYTSSNEFLYNVLYKLTVGHLKTRFRVFHKSISPKIADFFP